jgi:hypothetical protein
MTLTRITSTVGAVALGGVLVASTYGGSAVGSATAPDHVRQGLHSRVVDTSDHFLPPVAHKYGANGMRMGLHCDTHDPS